MRYLFIFLMLQASYCAAQQTSDKAQINNVLDSWHELASKAQFDPYFALMTKDAVFIGTSPEEVWNIDEFKAFAKPIFAKGRAWEFTSVERNVYVNGDVAWFDELLDTWMKLCRGSGVMRKENGQWKIAHYVLSMTIPNDTVTEVIKIITPLEDEYLRKIKSEK